MTGDLLQCRTRSTDKEMLKYFLNCTFCSQCDQTFCNCWESNGKVIDPFRVETSERRDMSCACARDKVMHVTNGHLSSDVNNGICEGGQHCGR